jgi:ElaB/YqjD/DUF883 family membrane-anchored ribosome-binding protein
MAVTTQQERPNTRAAADGARDTMTKIGDAAQGAVETAGKMASDAASFIGKKAESAASAVGSGLKSVAGTVESGAHYLSEHSVSEMGSDMTNLIRKNPIPALLIAVGVGFLLARAIRG